MKRCRRQVAPSLVTALFLCACGGNGTGPTGGYHFITVGVQNSTDMTLEVAISSPSGAGEGRPFTPGYTWKEIPGSPGQVVSFRVTGPGDLSGSGFCRASTEMAGKVTDQGSHFASETHGRVDLVLASGTTIAVDCTSGWLE